MATMALSATGSLLTVTTAIHLTSTQVDCDTCEFTFDSAWATYLTRTAVFYSDKNNIKIVELDEDDKCYVPWDVFGTQRYIYIGVYGEDPGTSILPTNFVEIAVNPGANISGDTSSTPSFGRYEEIWAEILAARGGETSLKNRIDDIDDRAQAAQLKADSMASGSPVGKYATVGALEAALPTGATGAYLVEADSHLYFWDTVTSAWVDGGEYNVAHASKVSITDASSHYVSEDVEGALEEAALKHKKYVYPESFTINTNFKIDIYKSGHRWFANHLIETNRIVGGVDYYASPDGNDLNAGSITAPITLMGAIAKADVGTIYLLPGDHYITSTAAVTVSKPCNWIAVGEGVRVIQAAEATWIPDGTYANVWKFASIPYAVGRVIDTRVKDAEGNYLELQLVASRAEAETTPNSYISAANAYVHLYDDSEPTDSIIFLSTTKTNFLLFEADAVDGSNRNYLEGIEFITTVVARTPTEQAHRNYLYAKDCVFYAGLPGENALCSLGAKTFLVNCIAKASDEDGFNYSGNGDHMPDAVEIDCIGCNNGREVDGQNNNGSTIHAAGQAIRVNCQYWGNQGGNVADIHRYTRSLNFGCVSSRSITDEPTFNVNFTAHELAEMWLYDCVSYGSTYDLRIEDDVVVYTKDNKFLVGQNAIIGDGVIVPIE